MQLAARLKRRFPFWSFASSIFFEKVFLSSSSFWASPSGLIFASAALTLASPPYSGSSPSILATSPFASASRPFDAAQETTASSPFRCSVCTFAVALRRDFSSWRSRAVFWGEPLALDEDLSFGEALSFEEALSFVEAFSQEVFPESTAAREPTSTRKSE